MADEPRGPGATDRERLAAVGLDEEDLADWVATGLPAEALGGWLTDRIARRPAGARARAVYGAEDVHDFARRAILEALAPGPDDALLDVGCGGGLLLRDAHATGCRTTGIDHSPAMVELARERAPHARVVDGDARAMPFADASFTAVSMSVVLFLLDDPGAVLRECHRVLRPGGRLAVYTTAPELRGTPAAPEPVASIGRFFSDEELARLAERAGFTAVEVRRDGGGQLLLARR